MNRIKQLMLGVLLATTLSAMACWWTGLTYNYNYIAGVNNYQSHYIEAASFYNAQYRNNLYVALPLTVYVRVNPVNDGEIVVTKTVLQYRIRRNGTWQTPWITVKTIENPQFDLETETPVPLFGNGTVDPKGLVSGDEIYLRYYITNGVIESGDLNNSIDSLSVGNIDDYSANYPGGWSPPFIFKVIYNGERRIGW